MSPDRSAVEHRDACGRVARRFRPRWLRSYVERKLQSDPAFAAAYELFADSPHPVLDIGCGVGLLGFYLRERGLRKTITGMDRDRRKIRRGLAVAEAGYSGVELVEGDVREEDFCFSGNVALLDVLHYLAPADQRRLLTIVSNCVAPGGILVIRDALRDGTARFWATLIAEKFAQAISWNVATPLHFPTRDSIAAAVGDGQFTSDARALWGRTPFNNYLLVFKRTALPATAQVRE